MNEKYDTNYRSAILCLLLNILVYTLIIHIIAAAFCYFIGWRQIYLYGYCLQWGGAIVIALGVMSILITLGGGAPRTTYNMLQYIHQNVETNTTSKDLKIITNYRFLIICSVVGILTILSGIYIQTLKIMS